MKGSWRKHDTGIRVYHIYQLGNPYVSNRDWGVVWCAAGQGDRWIAALAPEDPSKPLMDLGVYPEDEARRLVETAVHKRKGI
jgi:hypothetical protein